MKPSKFKAVVHQCSGCGYQSLTKTPVSNHLKAKCKDAKIISCEKVVSHFDEHDEEVFKATIYQCSKCEYTTTRSCNMNTHIAKTCVGAEVMSAKRIVCFQDIPRDVSKANVTATNCVLVSTGDHSVNTVIYLPPGSVEEYSALVKALSFLVDSGKLVLHGDISSLPATISQIARETDTRLDNKYVIQNNVVSRVDDTKIPVVKHSKKELHRLMTALLDALRLPFDADIFTEKDLDWDIDEITELRKQLLPVFYEGDDLERLLSIVDLGLEHVDRTLKSAEKDNFAKPSNTFLLGCRLLVEDPYKFKSMPEAIQKNVRIAAKKYLSTLPKETKVRPNNTL